jgi:hypothetical protein
VRMSLSRLMTLLCKNTVEADMPKVPPNSLACARMPWADASKPKIS